jgi:DnaA family protein
LALREDLRTRLGSGSDLPPAAAEAMPKRPRLAAQAKERALKLSPEAINYLLRHAPRDMRTLSMLVVALDQYTSNKNAPSRCRCCANYSTWNTRNESCPF